MNLEWPVIGGEPITAGSAAKPNEPVGRRLAIGVEPPPFSARYAATAEIGRVDVHNSHRRPSSYLYALRRIKIFPGPP